MRNWFTKDFHWKAFSVLMAIGIWLTVHRESEAPAARTPGFTENTYENVPVLAVSAGADVGNAQLVPRVVSAVISGPPALMSDLNSSQIHAFVNLTGFNSAQNLECDIEIALPPGATVVHVDPPRVTVTLPQQP